MGELVVTVAPPLHRHLYLDRGSAQQRASTSDGADARPLPKFIILNTQSIIFNTQSIICNTNFIDFDTYFIDLNADRYLQVKDRLCCLRLDLE